MTKSHKRASWIKSLGRLAKGLTISWRHLKQAINKPQSQSIQSSSYFDNRKGIDTFTWPYEAIPVPEVGRYQLHNEIDDCIVCDKCAKVCPVDCIDIEAIKSPEEIGKTSDGSSKRLYAAKFDIDMAKCCFCGLCTTVCPTECLTMSSDYDYSVFNLAELNFSYTDLSPAKAKEKREAWNLFQIEKEAQKATKKSASTELPAFESSSEQPKKVFKPVFKKAQAAIEEAKPDTPDPTTSEKAVNALPSEPDTATKKVFKPVFKRVSPKPQTDSDTPENPQ